MQAPHIRRLLGRRGTCAPEGLGAAATGKGFQVHKGTGFLEAAQWVAWG